MEAVTSGAGDGEITSGTAEGAGEIVARSFTAEIVAYSLTAAIAFRGGGAISVHVITIRQVLMIVVETTIQAN